MIEHDRHLFIIGHNIFKSIDIETIEQTTKAMGELDIYYPPYNKIDIRISTTFKYLFQWCKFDLGDIDKEKNVSWAWRFDCTKNENGKPFAMFEVDQGFGFKTEEYLVGLAYQSGLLEKIMKDENIATKEDAAKYFVEDMRGITNRIMELLIGLLAIKNIEKNTVEHKKFDKINKNKNSQIYKYITTLKIGQITETCRSNGSSSSTVRPHMRRGHIRTQHFGVGNKEIKKIFIQPVFVNADEGWIADQRKAYVVKAA